MRKLNNMSKKEKDTRPFVVIDLKDYVKKADYTFDIGDWNYYDDSSRYHSVKEAKDGYNMPDFKLPRNFTEEEKLECLNAARREADEQAIMADYIDSFHTYLLKYINELIDEDKLKIDRIEYKTCFWDEITLKVYYPIDFIMGDVEEDGDVYSDVKEYISSRIDFDACINSARARLENHTGSDDVVFKQTFLDRLDYEIDEVWARKRQHRKELRDLITSNKLSLVKKINRLEKMTA